MIPFWRSACATQMLVGAAWRKTGTKKVPLEKNVPQVRQRRRTFPLTGIMLDDDGLR